MIHYADFHAICAPLHIPHYTFVSVVNHLLEPHALPKCTPSESKDSLVSHSNSDKPVGHSRFQDLMQHPYDDETILVASGQLAVIFVPCGADHRTLSIVAGSGIPVSSLPAFRVPQTQRSLWNFCGEASTLHRPLP